MSVYISGIEPHSPAGKAKIKPGERLISLNGHPINDVLDYRFYMLERRLRAVIAAPDGTERTVLIKKEEYDETGMLFDSFLMDKQRTCRNNCIFCFIDQMPPGMRDTLYVKDDDARMSFLYGNYITLTNFSEREIDRIIEMKISPINVSVHTTNPELRCKMMQNRFAGEALAALKKFADGGISLNAQLVLCPGINDGEELRRSLRELSALVPQLMTVSCVPVGLTKYREGLPKLRLYTKEEAAAVIDLIDEFADIQQSKTGERIFYAADEFYLKAERPIPPAEYYGEFHQLENGVGMMALQEQQFLCALEDFDADETPRSLSIATGVAAAPFIRKLIDEARKKWHNLSCNVYAVPNRFFGETITVAGLLTGGDLRDYLQNRPLGDRLLIPDVMLKYHTDVFLDDMSLPALSEALNVPIQPVSSDGWEFLQALLGDDPESL